MTRSDRLAELGVIPRHLRKLQHEWEEIDMQRLALAMAVCAGTMLTAQTADAQQQFYRFGAPRYAQLWSDGSQMWYWNGRYYHRHRPGQFSYYRPGHYPYAGYWHPGYAQRTPYYTGYRGQVLQPGYQQFVPQYAPARVAPRKSIRDAGASMRGEFGTGFWRR
jgi:hypothetical protein